MECAKKATALGLCTTGCSDDRMKCACTKCEQKGIDATNACVIADKTKLSNIMKGILEDHSIIKNNRVNRWSFEKKCKSYGKQMKK